MKLKSCLLEADSPMAPYWKFQSQVMKLFFNNEVLVALASTAPNWDQFSEGTISLGEFLPGFEDMLENMRFGSTKNLS